MRILFRGVRGEDVQQWQRFLISKGLLAPGNATGIFGPRTEAATQAYQRANGLADDGEVGPLTLARALTDGFVLNRPAGTNSFYTNVIVPDRRFRNLDEVDDLDLLEPVTRQKVLNIIAAARNRGLILMVFETYRSRERQELLFARGVSGLREVGVHHYGLACDLVRNVNGNPSWKGDFSLVGQLARDVGLIWGGVWSNPFDPYHVQRCSLARQRSLFRGDWYPDANYDPYQD